MRTNKVPKWSAGLVNLRGRLTLSHAYFTGVVAFQKGNKADEGATIMEVLLDTGECAL